MRKQEARSPGNQRRRWWPTPSMALAGAAVFLALGGSAVAATGLIHAGDIAPGAVTSRAIKDGGIKPQDLSSTTRSLFGAVGGPAGAKGEGGSAGGAGDNGARGETGASGNAGSNGANGPNGADGTNGTNGLAGTNGAAGAKGADGAAGANGANGANGPNGANGANGVDGTNGTNGAKGLDGTNGTNGINGTIAPLSATAGLTALPTAAPLTTVVSLSVPAGNYVVLAKTELSHTGAGDTVECVLKAGPTTVDQIAMKTLPALAAIPASMQAVAKVTTPSTLSVECKVQVANGSANFNSLIAIPTA